MSDESDGVVMEVIDNTDDKRSNDAVTEVLRPLSAAQRKALQGIMQGNEAELQASVGVVREIQSDTKLCNRDTSGPSMLVPLTRAGIDTSTLANTLYEGLRAIKLVTVNGRVKRQPDHAVRLKFLELAHKLRGDYPTQQTQQQAHDSTYEARILTVMRRVSDTAKTAQSDTV